MSSGIKNLDDYRQQRVSFRWESPEMFNFGKDVVDAWGKSHPDKTAIHWVGRDTERVITFAEISARTNQVAQALIELGLQPGDRVLVILPRVVAWWESLLGIFKAGLVALPGTSLLTSSDLSYRTQIAEVAAVITDATGAERMDEIHDDLPSLKHRILVGPERNGWQNYEAVVNAASATFKPGDTRSDAPALIYFTSGTTGMPKMVLHTHASYGIGHQVTGRFWLDLTENDLHWNISDTGWAKAAWSSLFGPWICGASLFVQHTVGRFEPQDVLTLLEKYPVTTMCSAPTIYRLLVQQDLDAFQPAALRHCVAAGEPLNPEVIDVWRKATGLEIRDGYGQTESVLLCGNFPGVDVKPGSMGLPTPGIDLAVVDDQGHRLPPGEEGQIAVRVEPDRPLGLFREYWKSPEETAEVFRHGWYYTSDCATIDEDGYFWFVGRSDDVITSSAYRIGPFEVENALLEHPAVVEAAVVGKKDAVRGEIVRAFVVLAAAYQGRQDLETELQDHVKRVTAPYKYPRQIEFVDELPKTISGKIRRLELRQRK